MDLAEAFRNHQKKIVGQWIDYMLSSYKSSRFFKKEGDAFANPVGGTIRQALDALFLLLTKSDEPEKFRGPLQDIMRIRAVQEFTPSQAIAPINAVKHITRDVLAADKERCGLISELYDFEFAVDLAVLAAFDIYMECREQLYSVRINEIRSGRHILTDSKCPSSLLQNIEQEPIKNVENH